MSKIDIKVGDLVKLRYDLEDGGYYGGEVFLKSKNFKKVKSIDTDIGEFSIDGTDSWYTKEMIAEVKRPCQYKTIYKREEPILDDAEKRYLNAIIKPFRDKISHITKYKNLGDKEYISIYYYDGKKGRSTISDMAFPNFKKGTMYKGMKQNEAYKLEELGL